MLHGTERILSMSARDSTGYLTVHDVRTFGLWAETAVNGPFGVSIVTVLTMSPLSRVCESDRMARGGVRR